MKKHILIAGAVLLISVSACTKAIRYSPDEIKDFPPAIRESIRNNEVVVGMNKLQVRYSWGGPDEIIVLRPTETGKERIEWVYKKMQFFKSRLIFTDDTLTEIISVEPRMSN